MVLPDVEIFQPAALLALGSIGDDFEAIVAIDQRDILEKIALGAVRPAKCN
jgi:hypothetical protein